MEPSIFVGDIVLLNGVYSDDNLQGSVLAFYSPHLNQILVHRNFEDFNDSFISKGDNSKLIDSFVNHKSQIIGEVFFVIPTHVFFD